MFSPTATSRVGDSAGDAPCKSTDAQDLQPLQFDESVSTELTTSTEASTTCSTWTTTVPEKPDKSTELMTADNRLSSSTDNSDGFACDLGMWPVEISDSMREYWAVEGSGDCVNSSADFSKTSTRFEGDSYNRQCQKSLFTYTHELTKQQHPQTWLCYSPSKRALFCFVCKLMNDSLVFGKQGYSDWKHASQSIP